MSNKDAVKKYQEKCDAIMLRPPLDVGQQIRAAAAEAGQSVSGFIMQAVADRMRRDKEPK